MKKFQDIQLNHNQAWNSDRLIKFSQHLAQAYGIETNVGSNSSKTSDTWTAEKLIQMSKNLSSAYGIDF